jgi:hypothetical protein
VYFCCLYSTAGCAQAELLITAVISGLILQKFPAESCISRINTAPLEKRSSFHNTKERAGLFSAGLVTLHIVVVASPALYCFIRK